MDIKEKKSWTHLEGEDRWKARQSHAYKSYYNKHKDDEEFKAKRREAQRKYYQMNKEKVIARVKARQNAVKQQVAEKNDPEEFFANEH